MASHSNSPSQDLQGSSRVTGGSIGGHAIGNVFNFADADDPNINRAVPRTGKVHLYTSLVNPAQVKPARVLKINVSFSMEPVLKSIAAKWSPIQSKDNYHLHLTLVIVFQNPILKYLCLNKMSGMSKGDIVLLWNLMKMWSGSNKGVTTFFQFAM